MLETGIPNVLWRTEKMNNKLYGELQDDEHKFLRDVDTNYNPSLNERQPSDKPFAFKKEGSDFGLSDKISKMKFTFQNANNNLLLNEQLPSEHKFRRSGGIGGINSDFDSRAPKTDYRYVDPQFYEYRLNGMSIEKFVANKRMQEGDYFPNPDELDPTSRAINLRFERPIADKAVTAIQSRFRGKSTRDDFNKVIGSIDEDTQKLLQEKETEQNKNEKIEAKKALEIGKKIEIQKAKKKEHFKKVRANLQAYEVKQQLKKRDTKKEVLDKFKVKKANAQKLNKTRNDLTIGVGDSSRSTGSSRSSGSSSSSNDPNSSRDQSSGSQKSVLGPRMTDINNDFSYRHRSGQKGEPSPISLNSSSMDISPFHSRSLDVDYDSTGQRAVKATSLDDIPSVTARKVNEDINTEFARFIGKEHNQNFIEENADAIVNTRDLLVGERGKAVDKLPREAYEFLQKNLIFLKVNKNSTAETVGNNLDTIIQSDIIQRGKNSPFKTLLTKKTPSGKGKFRKEELEEGEILEEPKQPKQKARRHRPQSARHATIVPAEKDLQDIVSARSGRI